MCTEASLENLIPPARLPAVEVVARDNIRAALRVLVGRTVGRIITAADASARTGRLDELDVMIITNEQHHQPLPERKYTAHSPETYRTLRVAITARAARRIILTTGIAGVEPAELLRANTASDFMARVS